MNHLLDDYFKRDLTEDEEEQLAQWLASSQEGPRRFIGLMESHYRSLGLSQPEWAGTPLPAFFPKPGFHPLRLLLWGLLFLFFTALGYIAYRWFAQAPIPAPPPVPPRGVEKTPSAKSKTISTPPKSLSTSAGPKTATAKIDEELSVVVDNPHPGLVTVKVLNPEGKEIYLLYAGILPAGQKTFTWNGKAEDGSPSSSGVYYLEVTSGAHKLQKEIHLGPKS